MIDDTHTERVLDMHQLIAAVKFTYLLVGMLDQEPQGIGLSDLTQCLTLVTH